MQRGPLIILFSSSEKYKLLPPIHCPKMDLLSSFMFTLCQPILGQVILLSKTNGWSRENGGKLRVSSANRCLSARRMRESAPSVLKRFSFFFWLDPKETKNKGWAIQLKRAGSFHVQSDFKAASF